MLLLFVLIVRWFAGVHVFLLALLVFVVRVLRRVVIVFSCSCLFVFLFSRLLVAIVVMCVVFSAPVSRFRFPGVV